MLYMAVTINSESVTVIGGTTVFWVYNKLAELDGYESDSSVESIDAVE